LYLGKGEGSCSYVCGDFGKSLAKCTALAAMCAWLERVVIEDLKHNKDLFLRIVYALMYYCFILNLLLNAMNQKKYLVDSKISRYVHLYDVVKV